MATAAGLLLIAYSALTLRQLAYWRDSETLLEHTLQVTSQNYYAQSLLGNALFQQGKYLKALPHYQAAVQINPSYEVAHYKIGMISMITGDVDGAIRHLTLSLALSPGSERSGNARQSLARCLEIQRIRTR